MHILAFGWNHMEEEFRQKFGPTHSYAFWNNAEVGRDIIAVDPPDHYEYYKAQLNDALGKADVVFVDNREAHQGIIGNKTDKYVIFQEASIESVAPVQGAKSYTFGFCGLPTLLNRRLLEVSLYHEADREKLAETCAALGTDYRVVADRVGLVTPRVICQIINEACFTVQEGTATMQDVDLGMKLGTNYPHGPFAWANAIGVERVYAVLEAMWHDTHDERYKACPLLKRQALRGAPFVI